MLDGSSPGPVAPPNSVSPLPATPPPPLIEPVKGEDRKHLRPIGGERAQRRAPGGPGRSTLIIFLRIIKRLCGIWLQVSLISYNKYYGINSILLYK